MNKTESRVAVKEMIRRFKYCCDFHNFAGIMLKTALENKTHPIADEIEGLLKDADILEDIEIINLNADNISSWSALLIILAVIGIFIFVVPRFY